SGCLFCTTSDIMAQIPQLLATTEAGRKKVRLLGVTVTNFQAEKDDKQPFCQLPLPFPPPAGYPAGNQNVF
ncbi:MAG: hypothetical protein L3J49_13755, partial [Desulfobulbaceae bacterium]|nr:hypothetical protein [Desulfobulbaceae bacterium]